MGLGLSIVAQIVAEHRGQFECENAEEGGAVYTIRLPVSKVSAGPLSGAEHA